MSASPTNPQAFPLYGAYNPSEDGMTLWDYYAAHALAALGDHAALVSRGLPWLAEHAAITADLLLAEREKRGL